MPEPIDEILIYETVGKKAPALKYRITRSEENYGTWFCFISPPRCIPLGYPFEILYWAFPQLLNSPYKDGNRLEASPEVLDDMVNNILPGSLFDPHKELERELMRRYGQEFPEDRERHFG